MVEWDAASFQKAERRGCGIEARNAKEKSTLGLLIAQRHSFTSSKWARERKMDKHGRNVKAKKRQGYLQNGRHHGN